MAVLGLRFCARAFSSCGKWGPLLIAVRGPLTIAASPVAEHRLQTRRLSNCGSRAQPLRGMWDLPRPGLKPVSPALAGRFLTTVPPGKPQKVLNTNNLPQISSLSSNLYTHLPTSLLHINALQPCIIVVAKAECLIMPLTPQVLSRPGNCITIQTASQVKTWASFLVPPFHFISYQFIHKSCKLYF